jgi:hypothetical protein
MTTILSLYLTAAGLTAEHDQLNPFLYFLDPYLYEQEIEPETAAHSFA